MAGPRPASHSDGPETGAASSCLSRLAKPGWVGSANQAWMITFTDLVALMLAFFVLLFAMSQVEQKKWQGLVDSLNTDLNALKSVERVKPALDYHPEDEAVLPGADLDYLASVLRQQIAAHALLARGTIRRLPDRLVVSLPADLLFRANATTLAPGARDAGFALGGVLRNLNNRIEVAARVRHSDRAQGRRSDWQLALARAALFTGMLTRAGYRGPIVARGIVESRAGRQAPASSAEPGWLQGDRLDIVIHEFARESQ
ncbi:MAG: hypothetical protein IIA34_01625 [Proteobacteria bacterium]|nr:hypothetical protein [Pseudomonadota bacterium]